MYSQRLQRLGKLWEYLSLWGAGAFGLAILAGAVAAAEGPKWLFVSLAITESCISAWILLQIGAFLLARSSGLAAKQSRTLTLGHTAFSMAAGSYARNLSAARAFARAASTSRVLRGALVSSVRSRRLDMPAI
jgi:hypothetical protein